MNSETTSILLPLAIYAIAVLAIVGFMIGFSHIIGQRQKHPESSLPFESGMKLTGSARIKFPVQFYMVAMFFVIFDLEVVFIVAWAIAFNELGWMGYIAVSVFIFLLAAVFIYEWRIGALDFGLSGKKVLKQMKIYQKN